MTEKKRIRDAQLREVVKNIKSKNEGNSNTEANYRQAVHILTEFVEGYNHADDWKALESVDMYDLVEYLREERNLNDTTIKQHADNLAHLFDEVDESDLADVLRDHSFKNENLAEKFKGKETLWVEVPQYVTIVEACETTREELTIRMLWETGIRTAELSELTLQRIDRDEEVIRVRNKKSDGVRTIPYSSEIKPILREWLDYGGRDAFKTAENSPYLIVTQNSEQVQPNYINTIVRRVSDRSGVGEVYGQDAAGRDLHFPTAHHFRHAFATHRAANGMNLEILRDLMGHHSVEVTSHYVGLKPDVKKTQNEQARPKAFDMDSEKLRHAYKGLDQ